MAGNCSGKDLHSGTGPYVPCQQAGVSCGSQQTTSVHLCEHLIASSHYCPSHPPTRAASALLPSNSELCKCTLYSTTSVAQLSPLSTCEEISVPFVIVNNNDDCSGSINCLSRSEQCDKCKVYHLGTKTPLIAHKSVRSEEHEWRHDGDMSQAEQCQWAAGEAARGNCPPNSAHSSAQCPWYPKVTYRRDVLPRRRRTTLILNFLRLLLVTVLLHCVCFTPFSSHTETFNPIYSLMGLHINRIHYYASALPLSSLQDTNRSESETFHYRAINGNENENEKFKESENVRIQETRTRSAATRTATRSSTQTQPAFHFIDEILSQATHKLQEKVKSSAVHRKSLPLASFQVNTTHERATPDGLTLGIVTRAETFNCTPIRSMNTAEQISSLTSDSPANHSHLCISVTEYRNMAASPPAPQPSGAVEVVDPPTLMTQSGDTTVSYHSNALSDGDTSPGMVLIQRWQTHGRGRDMLKKRDKTDKMEEREGMRTHEADVRSQPPHLSLESHQQRSDTTSGLFFTNKSNAPHPHPKSVTDTTIITTSHDSSSHLQFPSAASNGVLLGGVTGEVMSLGLASHKLADLAEVEVDDEIWLMAPQLSHVLALPLTDQERSPNLVRFRDQSRFWVQRVLVPILMIIGLIGNVVTIIIMTRRRMRSSTNVYLAALATFDALYLLMHFVLSLKHYPNIRDLKFKYYWMSRPWFIWLTDASSNTSIWLTVAFTLERYIAVCHPIKGRALCTESRARKATLFVVVFCFIYTLPTPFEWEYSESFDATSQKTVANVVPSWMSQQFLYKTLFYWTTVVLFTLTPLVLLGVFNSFLIRSVRESRKERAAMTGGAHGAGGPGEMATISATQQTAAAVSGAPPSLRDQQAAASNKQESRITIMLIAVVILFLICQTPTASVLIYTSIQDIEPDTDELLLLTGLGNIFNFLTMLNAAGNFVLYCLLSQKYRKTFVSVFCPCLARRSAPLRTNLAATCQTGGTGRGGAGGMIVSSAGKRSLLGQTTIAGNGKTGRESDYISQTGGGTLVCPSPGIDSFRSSSSPDRPGAAGAAPGKTVNIELLPMKQGTNESTNCPPSTSCKKEAVDESGDLGGIATNHNEPSEGDDGNVVTPPRRSILKSSQGSSTASGRTPQ